MVQRPTDARERRLGRRLNAAGRHRGPQLGLLLPLQDRRDHDHEHGKRCFPVCDQRKFFHTKLCPICFVLIC